MRPNIPVHSADELMLMNLQKAKHLREVRETMPWHPDEDTPFIMLYGFVALTIWTLATMAYVIW